MTGNPDVIRQVKVLPTTRELEDSDLHFAGSQVSRAACCGGYGDAMMESKRAANSKVVQMVLRPALKEAK
jgi:hypothetical protein